MEQGGGWQYSETRAKELEGDQRLKYFPSLPLNQILHNERAGN
mgnify:CR=1 FL=1